MNADDSAARDSEFTLYYLDDMPKVVVFLMMVGARREVAWDLAQEAMAETYRKWDQIDNPGGWVRTVARRAWWRWVAKNRPETPTMHVEQRARPSGDESAEVENRQAFLDALKLLSPAQREVMAWTYDGYQPVEIAARIGKTPAAVRSLLRDARKKLRQYWTDEEAT